MSEPELELELETEGKSWMGLYYMRRNIELNRSPMTRMLVVGVLQTSVNSCIDFLVLFGANQESGLGEIMEAGKRRSPTPRHGQSGPSRTQTEFIAKGSRKAYRSLHAAAEMR